MGFICIVKNYFAVFAVAPCAHQPHFYAATTRPGSDKIGLPGGKVDAGESPIEALFRECLEEGWELAGEPRLVSEQIIDGKLIAWFAVESARMLTNWLEKGRVQPVRATGEELAFSGYGNERVFLDFSDWRNFVEVNS